MKFLWFCHWLIVLWCLWVCQSWAMVYDNRFMPLYAYASIPVFDPASKTCFRESSLIVSPFLMTGKESFANDEENDKGLFDMFGRYNQATLANAIIKLGFPNPFDVPGLDPLKFTDQKVLWLMDGKLETQGIAFQYDQYLGKYISTGATWFFMHLYSRNFFFLDPITISQLSITPEEAIRLDQVRRSMNDTIGIEAAKSTEFGFSDIDWYIRCGRVWEYSFKCKRIDAGIRVGALIPSGKVRVISNPASIPFGGNGHWGAYIAGDLLVELKEDWFAGVFLRVNKRFAKKQLNRIPIANEQELYGATAGPLDIDPGTTIIFSPYFRLDGLREGFGVQVRYTLVSHDDDEITDKRPIQTPPSTLKPMINFSKWGAEYFTVDAFYDFAKVRLPFSYLPIISVRWDIPIKIIGIAKDAAKTHRLSLGVEFKY